MEFLVYIKFGTSNQSCFNNLTNIATFFVSHNLLIKVTMSFITINCDLFIAHNPSNYMNKAGCITALLKKCRCHKCHGCGPVIPVSTFVRAGAPPARVCLGWLQNTTYTLGWACTHLTEMWQTLSSWYP